MSEYSVGATAPPFHPNCVDGSIIPCFEDDFAIDSNPISQNMSFDEWKKEFVNNGILTNADDRGIIKLSSRFVNTNDNLYINSAKIKPLDGYSDIVIHGSPTELLVYGNDGEEWSYNAIEAAELIRNSREFCGKPIRLIACQTGALEDGIAQQIADELGVNVLAPTEIVNVDIDGEMFISDNDILSRIWNSSPPEERTKIHETGSWIEFKPRRG